MLLRFLTGLKRRPRSVELMKMFVFLGTVVGLHFTTNPNGPGGWHGGRVRDGRWAGIEALRERGSVESDSVSSSREIWEGLKTRTIEEPAWFEKSIAEKAPIAS